MGCGCTGFDTSFFSFVLEPTIIIMKAVGICKGVKDCLGLYSGASALLHSVWMLSWSSAFESALNGSQVEDELFFCVVLLSYGEDVFAELP